MIPLNTTEDSNTCSTSVYRKTHSVEYRLRQAFVTHDLKYNEIRKADIFFSFSCSQVQEECHTFVKSGEMMAVGSILTQISKSDLMLMISPPLSLSFFYSSIILEVFEFFSAICLHSHSYGDFIFSNDS